MIEIDWNIVWQGWNTIWNIILQGLSCLLDSTITAFLESFSNPIAKPFWIFDIVIYSCFVLYDIGSLIYNRMPSYKKY